jgi:hypothetical protein
MYHVLDRRTCSNSSAARTTATASTTSPSAAGTTTTGTNSACTAGATTSSTSGAALAVADVAAGHLEDGLDTLHESGAIALDVAQDAVHASHHQHHVPKARPLAHDAAIVRSRPRRRWPWGRSQRWRPRSAGRPVAVAGHVDAH